MDEYPFPCIGVCQTDPETGICLGCGRPPDFPLGTTPDQDEAESPETTPSAVATK